jgi:hypothetical protein
MNLHNWFWYDIVESNTSVNTCSKTLDDSLERNDASIWNECSLQHLHVFSNGSGCHWSRTCGRLCRNCTLLRMQCPFHIFLNENHIVDVSMYNMSFKIVHQFSKYIIWYSSKTTEHTLGITPFDVGSSPLKSTIIWRMCILRKQWSIIWTYAILYACSTLLKGYSRPWSICYFVLCNLPLIWVRYVIKKYIIVG